MKILGIISLILGAVVAVAVVVFHRKEEDDIAKVCVWISLILVLIGIFAVMLPGVINPTK